MSGPIASNRTIISRRDGAVLPAYFAPAQGARRGGVVVIQEIFGLTDHIAAMCDRFAAAGYDALAPALFARIDPAFYAVHDADGFVKGREAVAASPWDQVQADVQAAIDALDGPVFVTGYCYGGAVSFLAAACCEGVAAASGFYGRLINSLLSLAPRVPTILHYGEHDAAIPLTMVEDVRAALPDVPVFVYDAGHGFCREGSSDFNAAARDLAMTRTLALFAEHG
jgi:carboxymethylenebutenolidase